MIAPHFPLARRLATAVAADPPYVYVGAASTFLTIDISTHEATAMVGNLHLIDSVFGIAIAGTRAYVANLRAGFRIVDIANPFAPALLGGIATPSMAHDVAVSGALTYVAAAFSGLRVIDPGAPFIAGSVPTGEGYDLALSAGGVLPARGSLGLAVAYRQCARTDLPGSEFSAPVATAQTSYPNPSRRVP
jgi:hypothetical protein